MYAASAPLPTGVDELLLAGLVRQKSVELTPCKTVDLLVPASAEIVLEGYIDPEELREEGPFGDHTGYYSLKGMFPVFHVTAITHRKNPIYSTIIVGKPPMEDCYLGKMTERTFLPLLRSLGPEIRDMDLPWEGVFHNCVLLSIEKRYPNQARKIMNLLWGSGQMSFAKMIFIFDEGVNLHDYGEVFTTVLDRLTIPDDFFFSEGILDELDHSTPTHLYGSKIGADLTAKIPGEKGYSTEKKREISPPNWSTIREILDGMGDIRSHSVPKEWVRNPVCILSLTENAVPQAERIGERLLQEKALNGISIFLLIDPTVDPTRLNEVSWKFFNNVDPNRDVRVFGNRLAIDATNKRTSDRHPREWPDEIVMSDDVKKRVDPIWDRLRKEMEGNPS
jgi:4-hydroxy-3-polyprenylbenzoate decarboxylase